MHTYIYIYIYIYRHKLPIILKGLALCANVYLGLDNDGGGNGHPRGHLLEEDEMGLGGFNGSNGSGNGSGSPNNMNMNVNINSPEMQQKDGHGMDLRSSVEVPALRETQAERRIVDALGLIIGGGLSKDSWPLALSDLVRDNDSVHCCRHIPYRSSGALGSPAPILLYHTL